MIKPLVSILLITYNQQEFIAQAIESVLMQNVDFPYEIIIGEDLGSDRTRAICEDYAAKYDFIHVLPRTKNLGVAGNWCDCVQHAQGKYIFMLDGDDYWTAPNKMQMQVDFMELHEKCIICHTDVQIFSMHSGKLRGSKKANVPEGMIQHDVLAGREQMTSSTMCLRTELVKKYIPFDMFVNDDFPCEDWPAIVILAAYGEIRYIPTITTVYRVGQPSVTHQVNYDKIRRYWQRSKHMTECIYTLFPALGEFQDGPYFDTCVNNSLLNAAYVNNDFKSAREFALLNPNQKRWATRCAKRKLPFMIYRILYLLRKRYE